MKILHVITGLPMGGAEMMLFKVLSAMDLKKFPAEVVCLSANVELVKRIEALGVTVHVLGMQGGRPTPSGLKRLVKIIKHFKPNVVQTWLYHADLIGGLAAKFFSNSKIVWNIRSGDLVFRNNKWHTYLAAKVCAWISPWIPDMILTNSHNAHKNHAKAGYDDEKFRIIPNGFDTDVFKPSAIIKAKIKAKLGIPDSAMIVGTVGRFHYQKDFATFIKTAAILKEKYPELHFCMCGPKINHDNEQLMSWINKTQLGDHIHLLGIRHDINNILASYDIFISSSSCGEAFGNVIGEAMSCAVPCVVTDVGDSAIIVDDTGLTVSPHDPAGLAEAADSLLKLSTAQRDQVGSKARQRVIKEYSLSTIAKAYSDFYQKIGSADSATQSEKVSKPV